MSKIIKAVFTGRFCKTQRVFQFDTDDKLQIVNVDLPANYTVDFSNSKTGDSVSVLATSDTVQIPPDLFVPGSEIYAWIWLSDSNGGHTRCEATIPIDPRARRTGTEPTPAQASAWDEAVDTLNETIEGIPAVINSALTEAKESGEFDGEDGADGSGVWYTTERISGDDNPFVRRRDLIGREGATVQVHDLLFAPDVGDEGEPTTLYEITSIGTACALKRLCKMQGEDGTSPGVTITEIEGGHRITITDEAHPDGQSFDVMDGQGGSGTGDYDDLTNKPSINSVTLSGDKSAADLGLAPAGAYVKPSSGIPAADLSASVQARLDPDVLLCVYGTTQSGEIQDALDGGILPVVILDDNYYMYSGYTDSQGYVFTRSTLTALSRVSCKNNVWSNGTLAVPQLSSATPAALGTASAGRAGSSSKADHVHPMPSAADVGAVAANQGATNFKKVLTVDLFGNVVPEDTSFVVTFTPTSPDYSGTIDKTPADIADAYKARKRIIAYAPAFNFRCELSLATIRSGGLYTFDFIALGELNGQDIMLRLLTSDSASTFTTKIYPLASGQWTGGSY